MTHRKFDMRDFFRIGTKLSAPDLVEVPDGARILNLGAGQQELPWPHFALDFPDWNGEVDPLPEQSAGVDVVFASHFLEHLSTDGVVHVLREAERVLRPGGTFNIVVPHGASKLAYEDLDHRTRFSEDTWRNLFRTSYYAKHGEWKFDVGFNVIFGHKLDNICLFTQLVRRA